VLDRRCAAIVLCHNHPNGDGLPSEHDERITRSIGQYLQPLSVKLLDHLVLANDRFFSIREQRHI
jgi:DNA repair protein RadC